MIQLDMIRRERRTISLENRIRRDVLFSKRREWFSVCKWRWEVDLICGKYKLNENSLLAKKEALFLGIF